MKKPSPKKMAGFVAIWEFHVHPRKRRQFEKAYSPDGAWARLFRQDKGYIRTKLVQDTQIPGRYLTLDFWLSRADYERFKKNRRADYHALDQECDALTQKEIEIGGFTRKPVRR